MLKPRSTSSRSAALALLWGLCGFAGLQLGLSLWIEGGLIQCRDAFYADKVRHLRRRLAKRFEPSSETMVVMLGSSRTGNGVRGKILEESLARDLQRPVLLANLGVPGGGPVAALLNFARLRDEGIRPDFLLVEVMPVFLARQPSWEGRLIVADHLRQADFSWLEQCRFPVQPLRSAWWEARLLPWYDHRFKILSYLKPLLLPGRLQHTWARECDETGWVPMPMNALSAEKRGYLVEKARRGYQPTLANLQLGGPSCEALHILLQCCRQERIPVALVVLPEAKVFQSFYGPTAWPQVEEFLKALRGEYLVPILDARDWVPDNQFSDGQHLLPGGADTFTRRLSVELRPLLTRKTEP